MADETPLGLGSGSLGSFSFGGGVIESEASMSTDVVARSSGYSPNRLKKRRRWVPLFLVDDFQSSPPNPPGDGDGDGDIPTTEVDLCAVTFSNGVTGGGDSFDCYDEFQFENDAECAGLAGSTLYPDLGSGNEFSDEWIHSENEISNPRGDKFECYAAESNVQTTDLKAGVVFTGSWVHSEGISVYGEDSFESYSDGVYATNTMSGGSGWTGNWISE